MNATAPQAIVKSPAAVILFDSADRRTPKPFGKGLLRYAPTYRVDYTAADARWWAEESARMEQARRDAEMDALVDELAREAAAWAGYMAGHA